MRCDKCGKRFEDNWVPDKYEPKYNIVQRLGVTGHTSNIYLCFDCSREFKDWLEEAPENELCCSDDVDSDNEVETEDDDNELRQLKMQLFTGKADFNDIVNVMAGNGLTALKSLSKGEENG